MKRTVVILTIAILSAGCSAFLDEQPQADLTRAETEQEALGSKYADAAEAQAELNGVYALFKADIYEMENFMVGDVMTDNCYVGGDGVNEEQFDKVALTATNSLVGVMWSQYYAIIGAATAVIENVKLMDPDSIAPSAAEKIIAEARFLRAWACFDVVRLWGDAPLTLELLPSVTAANLDALYPLMYPPRTGAEAIYDQILSDIDDDTVAALDSYSRGAFRASKGAAYGLRAKVLATRGPKAERPYDEVAALCDKVCDEGYDLVEDFDGLWTVGGKFSSEGIFELLFTSEAEQHNWAYWVLLSDISGSVSVTWRRYCTPTKELLARFDKDKDVRYASSFYWTKVPYDTWYPASDYPLAYKIRQKDSNIILLRLADILLLKAEALVETGNTREALRIVNRIRTRAHIPELDTGLSRDDARLAVENERQLELVLEGQRWYDLVRNGRAVEVLGIEAFRQLLPVPQSQMDINGSLTQNDGY